MNPKHTHEAKLARRLVEVFSAFLKLGCISFGGPVAHISYLREEFVSKRRWLDDAAYGDLIGTLPVSARSSQQSGRLRFGNAARRLVGRSAGFALFHAAFRRFDDSVQLRRGGVGDLQHAGWLHGLKLAAVAVVAQAVWGMGRNLCPDRARLTIAVAAAALLMFIPGALVQVGVIFGGGAIGWWLYRKTISRTDQPGPADWRHHLAGGMLAVFSFCSSCCQSWPHGGRRDRSSTVFYRQPDRWCSVAGM